MRVNYCVFLLLAGFGLVLGDINETCVTPTQEIAKCVGISSCEVISSAIKYLEEDALEFAKMSLCGYSEEHLVCCGSVGRFPKPPKPAEITTTIVPPSQLIEPLSHPNLPDATLCGIQKTQYRIYGGKRTEIDEFPWMAALKYTNFTGSFAGFRCSGTLITKKFVLTAAQCLFIPTLNLTEVRLGEWDFRTNPDCFDHNKTDCSSFVDVKIMEQIPHSFYNRRNGNNDIALLRLEMKIEYTDYIRPICLPPTQLSKPEIGSRMTICGWGVTETEELSSVKLKAEVPVLSNSACLLIYPNTSYVSSNQICAGGEEGVDACRGDSGGPLMQQYFYSQEMQAQQWYQEGIIYRGLGCGGKDVPSLYTRVTRYTAWILNHLGAPVNVNKL